MITVNEAEALVKSFWNTFDGISCDLIADRNYPPFDRVMMDGIAVAWKDYAEGIREFSLEGIAPAGEPQHTLKNSSGCFEVMTGAPLPKNADLIIPYEQIEIKNGKAFITQESDRVEMDFVHREGTDDKKGDRILSAGSMWNGPHAGIASSLGYTESVARKDLRIAIVSTGDELVAITETPLSHQIRRSNVYALQASLAVRGINQTTLFHLSDVEEKIRTHYEEHASKFDLIIYSGGVSKGKFDYLPTVWKNCGVKEIFHGVSQRPGKPLWFGHDDKNKTLIAGLPGNPVSSLVCLHRYFLNSKPMFARLTGDLTFRKELTYFVPVKTEMTKEGILLAHLMPIQNSGEFSGLAGSDGFVELPQEKSQFKAGEAYPYFAWSIP